jgi:glutathione S-transferase
VFVLITKFSAKTEEQRAQMVRHVTRSRSPWLIVATFCLLVLYEAQGLSAKKPSTFQVNQPTRFKINGNLGDVLASSVTLALRLGSSALVGGYSVSVGDAQEDKYSILSAGGFMIKEKGLTRTRRPKKMLQFYEFEACPFCKKVREAICILDLDVLMYPCPKGGPTYRVKARELGGKVQFPFLVDPNTNVQMYESDDIIQYLFDTYGEEGERIPFTLQPNSALTTMSASLSMVSRMGKGQSFVESKQPKNPLVFWGYDASPFCKVVRERLVELEIPHIWKTASRGSTKRNELWEKTGRFQVPFLEDPNNSMELFESVDIINYLNSEYAVASV